MVHGYVDKEKPLFYKKIMQKAVCPLCECSPAREKMKEDKVGTLERGEVLSGGSDSHWALRRHDGGIYSQ